MNVSSIGSFGFAGFANGAMNQPQRIQGNQFDLSELASRIIKKEDADEDGVISADESRLDSDRFSEWDTDGDGSLTSDELLAGLEDQGPPPPMIGPMPMNASEMASKIMEEEDTDGDGLISVDETRLDSDRFSELDTDGDGALTSDELLAGLESQAPPPPPPMHGPMPLNASEMASKIMEEEDADGDGLISVDETRLDSDRFSEMDTDGDGLLSTEELVAEFEARDTERATEMASMAGSNLFGMSNQSSSFDSFLQMLSQNSASDAYGNQNWFYQAMQQQSQNFGGVIA